VGSAEGLFLQSFYDDCRRLLSPKGILAAQSESPVLFREVFIRVVKSLRGIFPLVHPYFGTVPIYGTGAWVWTFASTSIDPMALDLNRVERIESVTRYYNRDIHRAAFAVPNEIRKELAAK